MMRRWFLPVILLLILAAYGGSYGYRRYKMGPETVLPEFVEPSPGKKAPQARYLSLVIGTSRLEDVKDFIAKRNLTCKDTSARAIMREAREKKIKEIEEKNARGETDAVSGASLAHKRSPKEKNPQIRLSCEGVSSAQLADRQRAPASGRLLFIFDSEDHPLRHISYRRVHRQERDAYLDASEVRSVLLASFGAATVESLPFPESSMDGAASAVEIFPRLKTVRSEWKYADLQVQLSVLNFGKRGFDVLESIEVPWPVRSDAPTLP